MANYDIEIRDLVGKIKRKEIRLPEMQRSYVWNKKQVCDLLDSIYRDYPSGTILTWKTSEEVPTRDFAISDKTDAKDRKTSGRSELLLDGQQRLTSLCAVIKGEKVRVKDAKQPVDILFNLDHSMSLTEITDDDLAAEDEETNSSADDKKAVENVTFTVYSRKLAALKNWVPVKWVFEKRPHEILEEKGISTNDEKYYEYLEILGALKDIEKYEYRVVTLESEDPNKKMSYEEIANIFVRVNSRGTKLRSADLALAQITAKWQGSLSIFEEFQEECADRGFDLDLAIHLKNLVAFASGQSRFKIVPDIPEKELRKAWEESTKAMNFAISFLRNNLDIEAPSVLSSPFILIPICYYWHHEKKKIKDEEKLKRWILLANMKGRYSLGSTESYLNDDLKIIDKGGNVVLDNMLDDLERHFGRLHVKPSDLEGMRYLKTMFIIFRQLGAQNWDSKIKLSQEGKKSHKIETHHIFPKNFLNEHKIDEEKFDDIGNLSFIELATNRKISDTNPLEYIEDFENYKDMFAKQCIPCDRVNGKGDSAEINYYLNVNNYDEFLQERRRLIAECFNNFLSLSEDS